MTDLLADWLAAESKKKMEKKHYVQKIHFRAMDQEKSYSNLSLSFFAPLYLDIFFLWNQPQSTVTFEVFLGEENLETDF